MERIDDNSLGSDIRDFFAEMEGNHGSTIENVEEVGVKKVGRKYIATIHRDTFVFASRKDAKECVERYTLAQWISAIIRPPHHFSYSLDQLRRVKAILTEAQDREY